MRLKKNDTGCNCFATTLSDLSARVGGICIFDYVSNYVSLTNYLTSDVRSLFYTNWSSSQL